ncbi:MAG: hypothetical protein IPJ82_15415 [Lewinellaceae bacterium]|nr:hypothetical protein [Lewinellaceae bacterium]
MASEKPYEKNVFINCPFDDEYNEIFRAILFTVHRCGFVLRCAKEFGDSDQIRINKIFDLIANSQYAIHDLSRVTLKSLNDLPRFNMPLELGIFIGCIRFGSKKHRNKKYLILESEDFRFKRFISDLSGQDIQSHDDNPELAIRRVRDWLSGKTGAIPSASNVWKELQEFIDALPELCEPYGWIPNELTFGEFSSLTDVWISNNLPQWED